MVSGNAVIGASVQLTGSRRGVDEAGHLTFGVRSRGGEEFFGEYLEVWTSEESSEFNIEIGAFGFANPEDVGNPYPSARLQFSSDECMTLEDLIRQFFSNLDVAMNKWHSIPEVRFLGGVNFRLGWIIRGRGAGPSARLQQLNARREQVKRIADVVGRAFRSDWKGGPTLEARQSILGMMDRMLDGSVTYLEGARVVAKLRFDAGLEADSDILPFVGVASETDALPLGRAREFWSAVALDDLQPKIREAEAGAKGLLENHCRNLIQRFMSSRETES